MRTKTLLLTAAIGAASLATSMAQVYSVNAVGYVNLTVRANHNNLINNPLNNGANTLNDILPLGGGLPDGTLVQTFDPTQPGLGAYSQNTEILVEGAGWFDSTGNPSTIPHPPGKAFLMYVAANPPAPNTPFTITFVGEVMQGANLSNPLTPQKFNMIGSQVPQQGALRADLRMTNSRDGDQVQTFNADAPQASGVPGGFTDLYVFIETGPNPGDGVWDPSDPVIPIGIGFNYFASTATPLSWTRCFNVNTPCP